MKNLDVNENSYVKDETNEYTDTVEKVIYKCINHLCILLVKNRSFIRGYRERSDTSKS